MAKSAAKETSLPVVVSLVFFVLTTLGLGVFAYMLYSDQEAKDAEVAKAKDEVKNLRASAKESELIARASRVFNGVAEPDDISVLQQDVKEGDKVHQEIKKMNEALRKKGAEVTKATADRFNAVFAAYLKDKKEDAKLLEPAAVGPDEFIAWTGDVEGGQLRAPTKTAVEIAARARVQRDLALAQASADRDAYAKALAQLDAASKAYTAASKAFNDKTNSVSKDLKDKMDALDLALNTKTKAYQTDTEKNRKELDDLTTAIDKLTNEKRLLKEDVERLQGEATALRTKIQPPDPLQHDEAQGRILRRLPNNVVEIDLGSNALVTPGLTFSVLPLDYPEKGRQSRLREFREPDERGVYRSRVEFVPKATIEVIEVIGPSLSRARITGEHDRISEAVLAGDLLYNSAWRRGVGEHIALIGVFDINGDGTDDVEAVVRDLSKMGISVDAVFDLRTQAWRGRMTERTRYLVEGYQIPVTASDPHQAAKAALISKIGAAREEARNKAIQIVNFRDFFGRIGYRVTPNVPEARISQAVARYFAGVGSDPMPMVPKD